MRFSTGKFDSFAYALNLGNDNECRQNVMATLETIEEILEQDNGGTQLQEHFNLCHPVDVADPKDISFFYEALIEFIIDYIGQFQ